MPLGAEVGLSQADFVLDGDLARTQKVVEAPLGAEPRPQFSAHVYSGQTAGWIKMPRWIKPLSKICFTMLNERVGSRDQKPPGRVTRQKS